MLSLDGFNINTVKVGTWVEQPSNQAHQTTTGPARHSQARDEAILAAAPASWGRRGGGEGISTDGQVSSGWEERLRGLSRRGLSPLNQQSEMDVR